MIKKICCIGLFAVFISCLLPLAGEKEASADNSAGGSIRCTSSVEADFPLKLLFNISADSSSQINDIRLHYSTNIESIAPVTSEAFIKFTPGTSINAQWSWDMRKTGGLPPGAIIKYWWTVKDASGNKFETAPASIKFDDDRYKWQSLAEGNLKLYWYYGTQSFAAELMSAAQQALIYLKQNTGVSLKKSTEIYVYANTRDLQGAMVFPQEWTGGVAFAPHNIIAIGIEPYNIDWGKSAMAHELTHLVIHQMVHNPYSGLPTWLDEGLAMYTEGPLDYNFASHLANAVNEDRLISVRSLSSPFSTDTGAAYLSYAQSYSLVEFMVAVYGQDYMLELLTIFSRGCAYDEALQSVYGFDIEGLNALWRDYARKQYGVKETKITASLPILTGVSGYN